MLTLSYRLRSATSWLLVAGLLLQPLLAYLVTPTVAHTRDGIRVAVCTLKGGQRDVVLELPAIDDSTQAGDECPAIKLFQLAGIAQLPTLPALPAVVLERVSAPARVAERLRRQLHFSVYSSRAPPTA